MDINHILDNHIWFCVFIVVVAFVLLGQLLSSFRKIVVAFINRKNPPAVSVDYDDYEDLDDSISK